MDHTFTKDVESSIEAAVHSGHFASADDAVVAAWRVFEQTRPRAGASRQESQACQADPNRRSRSPVRNSISICWRSGLRHPTPRHRRDFDDPDDEPIAIRGSLFRKPSSASAVRWRIISSIPAPSSNVM